MRKFVLGFILLLCFSVFAQENENCGIVFSTQSVFQKIVQHDGLFSLDKFQFAGGKNAEIKTDFNASLRAIEEAKFLSEKADFCRNMSWASVMGAVGCTAIGAFNKNLSCDTEDALFDIASNCVLSLFYFPLYESSYRNDAANKYNQFGLID
ncbi:hypothetical protein [uncultured Treponema sp.]|uniref:hypothetical protein n=1 Tax=uncultured Treponema sp. TaxID=162155 RepID=UPI002591ED60|nr:hypothetical protein [uncultured Treponema sp.]